MSWAEVVLKTLSSTSRRVESCAKHPILYLLIVNHDARLREKCHKAVFNAEFDSCSATVVCASSTPQIERSPVCLELPNVLNDAHHRNSSCASGSHQRVIDINVNNHDSELAGGVDKRLAQRFGEAVFGATICPPLSQRKLSTHALIWAACLDHCCSVVVPVTRYT